MRRGFVLGLVASVLLMVGPARAIELGVVSGTILGSVQPAPAPTDEARAARDQLLALVNADRVLNGRSVLEPRAALDLAAHEHSLAMAAAGDIWHNDTLFLAATKQRLQARLIGENVATNVSIDDAHRRLMASPGHRANLLSESFGAIGIGVVRNGASWYLTEIFIAPLAGTAPASPTPPPPPAPAPVPPPPAPDPAPADLTPADLTPAAPPPRPAPTAPPARPALPAPAPALEPEETPAEPAPSEPAPAAAPAPESEPSTPSAEPVPVTQPHTLVTQPVSSTSPTDDHAPVELAAGLAVVALALATIRVRRPR